MTVPIGMFGGISDALPVARAPAVTIRSPTLTSLGRET